MTAIRVWLMALVTLWVAALVGVAAVLTLGAFGQEPEPHFYSDAQAASGMIAYGQNCASCHGADLAGEGGNPPLVGDEFWVRWEGRPVADLFDFIQSKMPLGRGNSLSDTTYLRTTAVVLWANRLPAGERPLLADTDTRLDRDLRLDRRVAIAPEVPSAPALLGRWVEVARAGRALDDDSAETSVQGPTDGRAQEDATTGAQESTQDDPAEERESAPQDSLETTDAAPTEVQADSGDLRLTVLPEEAKIQVRSTGNGGDPLEFEGGSYVIPGLEAGEYTIRATLGGRVLQQTVTVRLGAVLEVEMRFPGATLLDPQQAPAAPLEVGDAVAGVMLDGHTLYRGNCAACHGAEGSGGFGPPLASNPRVEDAAWTARRVILGGLGMPSFAHELVDAEIAAVISYVRTSFGNDYGRVSADRIEDVRAGLEGQIPQVLGADLELAPLGQQRYTMLCSACHGLMGGGDVGPPLAGNPVLANNQATITTILYGRGIMPSFAHHSDRELAAIASYIRTAWSNEYAPVAAAQVAVYRPENDLEGDFHGPAGTETDDTQ